MGDTPVNGTHHRYLRLPLPHPPKQKGYLVLSLAFLLFAAAIIFLAQVELQERSAAQIAEQPQNGESSQTFPLTAKQDSTLAQHQPSTTHPAAGRPAGLHGSSGFWRQGRKNKHQLRDGLQSEWLVGQGATARPPDIFVGVFTTVDSAATHAVEAWTQGGSADNTTANTTSAQGMAAEQRYRYRLRRAALRSTWFPAGRQELQRVLGTQGCLLRFVVGSTGNPGSEGELEAEHRLYGDLLRLRGHREGYAALPAKTLAFFVEVSNIYQRLAPQLEGSSHGAGSEAQLPGHHHHHVSSRKSNRSRALDWMPRWVLKVDDDVWLSLPRLTAASQQWGRIGADYVGCMKHGMVWTQPGTRWYEPQAQLLGPTYYLHAYGSAYVLAGWAAHEAVAQRQGVLRLLANEDTSVGAWLLGCDLHYFEDMRLCTPACHPAAVAVARTECAGLCEPLHDLLAAQRDHMCTAWGAWDVIRVRLMNGTFVAAPLKRRWSSQTDNSTGVRTSSTGRAAPAIIRDSETTQTVALTVSAVQKVVDHGDSGHQQSGSSLTTSTTVMATTTVTALGRGASRGAGSDSVRQLSAGALAKQHTGSTSNSSYGGDTAARGGRHGDPGSTQHQQTPAPPLALGVPGRGDDVGELPDHPVMEQQPRGPVWPWWEVTQVTPGELPYLPSHPEHKFMEDLWA